MRSPTVPVSLELASSQPHNTALCKPPVPVVAGQRPAAPWSSTSHNGTEAMATVRARFSVLAPAELRTASAAGFSNARS